MAFNQADLTKYNALLKDKSPSEIVEWALNIANRPILTTKFGPGSASLIFLVTRKIADIPVIWCDTGYNTPQTYRFAEEITQLLKLNLHTYVPRQTAAYRDTLFEGIPTVGDANHQLFTDQVKLEPFRRALNEHNPDLWFTNLRKGQTNFRDNLNIVNLSKEGILKVSPFYFWNDHKIHHYLTQNQLPNETRYFDPSKIHNNRECGLHVKF